MTVKIKENRLSPVLKYPGGKEKELKYILPNLPGECEAYYEPFVGGGAVYFALESSRSYINDKSPELISLYRMIQTKDCEFIQRLYGMEQSWQNMGELAARWEKELRKLYRRYKKMMQKSLTDIQEKETDKSIYIDIESKTDKIRENCSEKQQEILAEKILIQNSKDTPRNVKHTETAGQGMNVQQKLLSDKNEWKSAEKSAKQELEKETGRLVKRRKEELKEILTEHIIPEGFADAERWFAGEMSESIRDKMMRMHKLEEKKGQLSEEDLEQNLECALKNALYMYLSSGICIIMEAHWESVNRLPQPFIFLCANIVILRCFVITGRENLMCRMEGSPTTESP